MKEDTNLSTTAERKRSTQETVWKMGEKIVGTSGIIFMMAYLIILSILLLGSLIQLWPSDFSNQSAGVSRIVQFFFWTIKISDEVRLLLIVGIAGALGSLIHALRSLSWYVGNRKLVVSWLTFYILLPFVGGSLSILFYLVIRGGFFSPQATAGETSPFGFAAISGLVGMFTEQAVLKLKEVAQTLLTKPGTGKDAIPQEASEEEES